MLSSFLEQGTREVASPCSSSSEPCVLSGGFVLVFVAVVLRTCHLDQALMSWSGATTGWVGPCPGSESESLLVLLLLELDSSGGAAAATDCSLRSGFGGGGLTPGGAPSCEAGSLLALSFLPPFAWRTAFGGVTHVTRSGEAGASGLCCAL